MCCVRGSPRAAIGTVRPEWPQLHEALDQVQQQRLGRM
jgi:hypothetical protein